MFPLPLICLTNLVYVSPRASCYPFERVDIWNGVSRVTYDNFFHTILKHCYYPGQTNILLHHNIIHLLLFVWSAKWQSNHISVVWRGVFCCRIWQNWLVLTRPLCILLIVQYSTFVLCNVLNLHWWTLIQCWNKSFEYFIVPRGSLQSTVCRDQKQGWELCYLPSSSRLRLFSLFRL